MGDEIVDTEALPEVEKDELDNSATPITVSNDNELKKRSNGSSGRAEGKKNKKPGNTAFKQQRLPAWQPILTAGTVLPMFFLVGIIFIPLGVGFLVTSSNVKEMIVDYTDCVMENDTRYCHEIVANYTGDICRCRVEFNLTEAFAAPVYIYYRLENYYQNHRRYVNSRDDLQLLGRNIKKPSSDCDPYRFYEYLNSENKTVQKPYAPCGAIANSMFNDTLSFEYGYDDYSRTEGVKLDYTGIAWPSDVGGKFKNPVDMGDFNDTLPPPNWQFNITDLPNQFLNESFIVWMRTSAFPTFRKLHSKVILEEDTVLDKGLPAGRYYLHVDYKYPVTMFDGKKSVVISTTSWLGGKNNFLGVAYLVTGSLCILFGAMFLCIHVKYGQKMKV